MQFGMSGCFLPDDMADMIVQMCLRVRALGFSGIFTRFRKNDPHDTPKSKAEIFRSLLADNGLRLFQTTGYWQNLVTPDESARQEAVKTVQGGVALSRLVGIACD